MGDRYNAKQAGIMGKEAGSNATVNQYFYESQMNEEEINNLNNELEEIKKYLRKNLSSDEHEVLLGNMANATQELKQKNTSGAMDFIKKGGKLLYDIAKSIGCSIIVKFLAKALNLG